MHLLATTTGVVDGGAAAVDLKQPPGDIVVLSAADSDLALLATAADRLPPDCPSLRLANLLLLQHNYSVDLYAEQTLASARLVVVRLLGGRAYWTYGVDRLRELAAERGIKLAFIPGGSEADPDLTALSTLAAPECEHLRHYLAQGGPHNAVAFWQACAHVLVGGAPPPPAVALPKAGEHLTLSGTAGRAAIVFYRALVEAGDTGPVDALAAALQARGLAVSAVYLASLKDTDSAAVISTAWQDEPPDVILNLTSFAVGSAAADPLAQYDCPVLQVSLGSSSAQNWHDSTRGLAARDLAMSIVLPELDGRIASRAIAFKAEGRWHARTHCRVVGYQVVEDRTAFVAELAARWTKLRHTPAAERRIAILLANYPNKEGRLANGVGYDTPASTIAILRALAADGVAAGPLPDSGNALMEQLQAGVTNAHSNRLSAITLPLADYETHFSALPSEIRDAVTARWGTPDRDPFIREGTFHLPLLQFGTVIVGIQPARGYNIDPKDTYHDPTLVPPHGYFATYMWLRHVFGVGAIIHNGKHGNLEWLPGKSTALSAACYPEAVLGPLPHVYPFIVNDPGEGTAAKRRASAVIIDHLTPPLTRAESYGPLKDLEALVDEYYLASGLDTRRLALLKQQILDLTRAHRLDEDAGFTGDDDSDLQRLDTFLCDLKEAQIRDGLHILGEAPQGAQLHDLLVALTRVPRGNGAGQDQSITRALALDMGLHGFDPLTCTMAAPWTGPRPTHLQAQSDAPWRTAGDTVERIELAASAAVASGDAPGPATAAVLHGIATSLRPRLHESGTLETANLLRAVSGRAVAAGPAGAPTRGRLDVLPTGRNFYSLDNRTLPTPAAWTLGKASADALLARHFQDTGTHLRAVGLSVWGTSNMRTGGDDLAQALWLMGVKPAWDSASWRVTGFEVQPPATLGRPRVDVTLRISGFFRDAFPAQIELLDKAIRAVAALDEDESVNPLAARTRQEAAMLVQSGFDHQQAQALAAERIFGSKPGAYGAGLQALIDEGIWSTRADLAAAYVTWGAYVYGAASDGRASHDGFQRRLAGIEAVLHNQDNREHDLLDSDDYYQFEGGMSAAVEAASGRKPTVYHNDHSRPERPLVRTLDEEVSRVMRSRVVNPKWITGVKRHGYKGAFEIAATVDYMFAFAATADAVKSHHFDIAYDAYVADEETLRFMQDNNPAALREMAARFLEAMARGLWQPRLNSAHDRLKDIAQ